MNSQQRIEVRNFCLATIKEVYGYEYRPLWHADLDDLLRSSSMYDSHQGGAFIVIRREGKVIACGGLRNLQTHTASNLAFAHRYQDQPVGALWRVYVNTRYQTQGLGSKLVRRLEARARKYGYQKLYLHTSRTNPDAVKFWQHRGYAIFVEDDTADKTVHMEKSLL